MKFRTAFLPLVAVVIIGLMSSFTHPTSKEGNLKDKLDLFKSKMLENPSIKNVMSASGLPIYMNSSTSGGFRWEGKDPESEVLFQVL
jgi:hypothetical protein